MLRTDFVLRTLFTVVVLSVAAAPAQDDRRRDAAERTATRADAEPLPHVEVFARGKGAYHTYRIPAVVVTKAKTVLAFCEGRKSGGGDAGNIDILLRRSSDAGKTWSDPIVVWDDGKNTCGNPAPVVDQTTGTIWLLLTWNLGSDHERQIMSGRSKDVRHVFVTHSDDDGKTWAKPRKISKTTRKAHWRWYATGPCNAIQLTRGPHKGRLLVPANHSDHRDPEKHPYRSHVIYSDDHGKTWLLGGVHEQRTNESTLVELADGAVLQAMRSYHGKGLRALATSKDGGATWSELRLHEQLVTPVCQASLLRYSWTERPGGAANAKKRGTEHERRRGRSRILFSSPHGKSRSKLSVWLSYDEGKTWPIRKLIHPGSSAYSDLVKLPNGKIGALYEKDGYRSIELASFSLDWLEATAPLLK